MLKSPYFKYYRQIGRSRRGEIIYQKDTGEIFIEKDWQYLVRATPEDLKDAEFWD